MSLKPRSASQPHDLEHKGNKKKYQLRKQQEFEALQEMSKHEFDKELVSYDKSFARNEVWGDGEDLIIPKSSS